MSRSIAFQPLLRTAALTVTACCLALAASSGALAQQSVQVSEKDGLLSVQASNTSASALAQLLTDELGISVVVTGDTEALVNIDIVDEPLDKALSKLSPNHMLVRSDKDPHSTIIEVVLMMGEGGASGSSGGDDQFLPSGSPADDIVISDEQPLNDNGIPTGAPDGSQQIVDAPPAQVSDLPPEGDAPPPEAFDPVTGMPIDPLTGQPVQ